MKTFKSVGKKTGLTGRTLERYIYYMKTRWGEKEDLQCKTGYAEEWAMRFKMQREFSSSDSEGQSILKEMARSGGEK
jgi:hypothetical protein